MNASALTKYKLPQIKMPLEYWMAKYGRQTIYWACHDCGWTFELPAGYCEFYWQQENSYFGCPVHSFISCGSDLGRRIDAPVLGTHYSIIRR